jgi:hypothetical protein
VVANLSLVISSGVPQRIVAAVVLVPVALTLVGCSSTSSDAVHSSLSSQTSARVISASAAASAVVTPSTSAPAPSGEPLSGPCDLLSVEQITAATGITVPDGSAKADEARQIQMCTWQSTDPFLIVAASLTDVGAVEAFQTNVDLAPAYFDGDPVTISLPGAEKAYAVQQPDVGWVIGAIAKGRFVQVQVGGNDVTQQQVATLVEDAISRMPA